MSVTLAPASTTSPAASCPITSGGIRRPVFPSSPWTSLPQIPQARTRTSTSSGPIAGTGISTISSCMYCVSKSAFIATELSSHVRNRELCPPPRRPLPGAGCAPVARSTGRTHLAADARAVSPTGRHCLHRLAHVAIHARPAVGARAAPLVDSARDNLRGRGLLGRRHHHHRALSGRIAMGKRRRHPSHVARLLGRRLVCPVRDSAHPVLTGRRHSRTRPGSQRQPPPLHPVARQTAAARNAARHHHYSPPRNFPSAASSANSAPDSPSPLPCKAASAR